MGKLLKFGQDARPAGDLTEYLLRRVIGHADSSLETLGPIVVQASFLRKPYSFQLVIERKPVTFAHPSCSSYFLTYFDESLACGHVQANFGDPAKRRNCRKCAAQIQVKKPSQSVRLKEKAA